MRWMVSTGMLAVAVAAGVSVAAAQGRVVGEEHWSDTTDTWRPAATHFVFGTHALDVDALERALVAAGLPGMNNNAVVTGLMTEVRTGRMVIGVNAVSIAGTEETNSGWRTELSGGYGMLDVGMGIRRGRWLVTPMVGAGFGRIKALISSRAGGDFGDVPLDPGRGTELAGWTPLGHVSVAVERVMGRAFKKSPFSLALRAGYVAPLGGTEWQADNNDLTGGPDAAFDGAYLQFGMGVALPRRGDALFPALGGILPWLSK